MSRLKSICPYFAMFPESFADDWIKQLTATGDVILDPFCGRGTTAFQCLANGRRAVSFDVNDVAVCITKAKTQAPPLASVRRRLTQIEAGFERTSWQKKSRAMLEFFQMAYHVDTLPQILYLRSCLDWKRRRTDCMIAAIILGALHGESHKSPSYLSNRMPRTISTKPDYSVRYWKRNECVAPRRDAFELLRSRLSFRYDAPPPSGESLVIHRDMRELPWIAESLPGPIRCVITSPPYFDVTNFEEDQWLRLWFLGGPPYPTRGRISRDDRYERADRYWSFIADMWRSLGQALDNKANVVIRFGGKGLAPDNMVSMLKATSQFSGRRVQLVSHQVSEMRGRQTDSFLPGSKGCLVEVDCHFHFAGGRIDQPAR